jgi:uncharacterized LabA/DUF88 family protein
MAHRVSFLVDGFNIYHSLREVERLTRAQVRWLDLRKLCEAYLHAVRGAVGDRVDLASVTYFSAFATHLVPNNPDVVRRHQTYVDALRSTGVDVVMSRFKAKTVTCPLCGGRFKRHEEKETDVAIGLQLTELFVRGACETAVLITGDTDLVPAIRSAKRLYPAHTVGMGFPFMRHNAELRAVADFAFNISQRDVQRAQLPHQIHWEGQVLTRPASW